MTDKSRLLGLMARREAAELARARRGFAEVARDHQAAEAMVQRLNGLQGLLRDQSMAAVSVAALREQRRVAHQIAAEADRLRQRSATLQSELDTAATRLAQKDHRHRVLDDAARTARHAEQIDREARKDAAQSSASRPKR